MNTKKILSLNKFDEFLQKLMSAGKNVLAPQKVGQQVDFLPLKGIEDITHEYVQTNQSAKFAFLPRVEELFSYQTEESGKQIVDRNLDAIPEVVLFGVRPCDAVSIGSLKALFNWDYQDSLFNARLAKTTVVAVSCAQADADCFCTSIGYGPGDTTGSDLLLTRLKNGDYLVEIISEKGQKTAELVSDLLTAARDENKDENLAQVDKSFDYQELEKKLLNSFDNPVYIEQSLRCLGCGACAFVCPVCACFDIQDEGNQKHGKRLRSWDACGFSLFTVHTSGHNPRHVQSERWRQRLLHKFSYMPERLGVLGCVGCGRCSRACPVDMNMLQHVKELMKVI